MYIYIYVYMYICLYIYINIFRNATEGADNYRLKEILNLDNSYLKQVISLCMVSLYVQTYIYIHIFKYAYICMYTYMFIYIYKYIYRLKEILNLDNSYLKQVILRNFALVSFTLYIVSRPLII
jgi:hypothetical protein